MIINISSHSISSLEDEIEKIRDCARSLDDSYNNLYNTLNSKKVVNLSSQGVRVEKETLSSVVDKTNIILDQIHNLNNGLIQIENDFYDYEIGHINENMQNTSTYVPKENVRVYYQHDYKSALASVWPRFNATGCGPTSFAMVISTLLDNDEITPVETASKVKKICGANETIWRNTPDVVMKISDEYGLDCERVNIKVTKGIGSFYNEETDRKKIIDALKNDDSFVIAIVGDTPSKSSENKQGVEYFHTRGHFIVLSEIDDNNNVKIYDSASQENTNKGAEFALDQIVVECKGAKNSTTGKFGGAMWIVSKHKTNPNN